MSGPRAHGSIDPGAAAEAEAAAVEIGWDEIFDLYPQQLEYVLGSSRPIQGWVAGRGTGKSHVVGGPKALHCCLRNPGMVLPGGRVKYCPGALFGRTMDEAKDPLGLYFEDALDRFQTKTGIPLLAWYNNGSSKYTLVNGATLALRSYGRADMLKKKGRSPTYAWAGIDEIMFADVDSQQAFMTIQATIRHPLAREPQLFWATSPDGYRGVVRHCLKLWNDGDPDVFLTTATTYDNPHVSDRYRRALRAACTDRQAEAELFGKVLKPIRVVYSEYDDSRHVVPWEWDSDLPWVLMVDWGETWGWVGAAQVVTEPGYRNRAGGEYRPGTWVVAREWPMTDGSRPAQRRAIVRMIRELGYPRDACADRAVPMENDWLSGAVGPDCPVHVLEAKDQQQRSWGIGAVQWMLDPGDGRDPRLLFASSLEGDLDPKLGTIRAAMQSYQYREFTLDNGEKHISSKPVENTPDSHAVDALRYGIACTVWDDELHGGTELPYVQHPAHSPREDADAGYLLKQSRRPRMRR